MKISLHKSQGIVFHNTSRFKVVAAGRRFGKTVLAAVIMFIEAAKTPNGVYWYVSPTYKQSKQNAWKIFLRLIPREILAKKPNETELSFTLRNGAEIHLKGADNPDSLRGSGLDGLIIDEFASIRNSKSVWEEILRPTLSDKLGWCIFIGTPKGKDAFWEIWMKGQRQENGYMSWSFKTEDNPYIPRSEIREAKEQLSDRYFRQEYEASFEDFTGLIWPEFDESIHVIEPCEIPDWYELTNTIDPAVTGTTGALYGAIDDSGTVFIRGEYYEQNKRASEVSEVIREIEGVWYGDPAGKSMKVQRDGILYSLFDEYEDNGIDLLDAQKDVSAGINRVAEYFKAGKIKIFNTCHNLIEELRRYHWSEERETVSGVLEPKPYKSKDHLCDCLRYLIMSRPDGGVKTVKKPFKGYTVDMLDRMEEQQAIYDEE